MPCSQFYPIILTEYIPKCYVTQDPSRILSLSVWQTVALKLTFLRQILYTCTSPNPLQNRDPIQLSFVTNNLRSSVSLQYDSNRICEVGVGVSNVQFLHMA